MPDEEALLIVVGVDESAGDAVRAVAADLAGGRLEDIDAVYLHLDARAVGVFSIDRVGEGADSQAKRLLMAFKLLDMARQRRGRLEWCPSAALGARWRPVRRWSRGRA